MTDIIIKFINLPIRAQRIVAASVLSLIFSFLVAALWAASSALLDQNEQLLEDRRSLARLERLIAMDVNYAETAHTTSSDTDFLVGNNEPVIQATLQSNLNSIAAATGATVVSAGGIPTTEKNGVRFIGIRANIQGTMNAIHKLIVELETGKPYVAIKDITVRGTNVNANGRLAAPVELSVQISFSGALNPTDQSSTKRLGQ